ncbi:MAG: glycerol-3-phosphate dehydrogenase [Porphyromonas sp.]|nr:glycerol-3-phosphate dehydrogenase [Porphyromonas sp.]
MMRSGRDKYLLNKGAPWSPGRIGIIGSGSWATALAKILLTTQEEVNWYFRFRETVKRFQASGHNPSYLTSVEFDTDRINFYTDIPSIVENSDTLLLVTPSPYIKGVLERAKPGTLKDKFIINAIKGIITDEYVLITEYLMERYGLPKEQLGVVSGPCHAEEVALERLSYLTVATADLTKAEVLKGVFEGEFVSCKVSSDLTGIEYSSVMKNIYAIMAGVCQGLRMGDNFQAVLLSNAAAEIDLLLNRVSSNAVRKITDSVYLGDLMVTAYSRYSRNRTLGTLIGRGYSVKQAQLEMEMVAEGYYGTKCIHEVNKDLGLELPIAEAAYDILYRRADPAEKILELSQKLT